MSTGEKPQLTTGGIPMIAVNVLLPVLLSVIAGYGAVKYSAGDTDRAIKDLQRQVEINRLEIERVRTIAVTRDEMKLFIDQARQDLQDIKSDLREIRNRK